MEMTDDALYDLVPNLHESEMELKANEEKQKWLDKKAKTGDVVLL